MSSLNIIIQEAQKLHYQLALSSSAVIGHLEGSGVNQDSVYTIAIYEQMGDNTTAAGRLWDQLCSLGEREAAPEKVVTEAKGFASGISEQPGCGAGNEDLALQFRNLLDELNRALDLIGVYDVLGLENNEPNITGTEVSILVGSILDQLRPIKKHLEQLYNNAIA